MERFDAIIVGGGSGLDISSSLAEAGWKVAIVEEGPMGGTCLNRGCIPSKIVIHSGDVMEMFQNASKFGIRLTGKPKVDFAAITKRASSIVDNDAKEIEEGIRSHPKMTLYKTRGEFTGSKTMRVGKSEITADKIFIMAGTRSSAAPIPGLDTVDYLTSTEALRLTKQPKHMVVLGGGYIATELAHFYGALGTKITMIQRSSLLLTKEDTEIATIFTREFGKKHTLLLGYEVADVRKKAGVYTFSLTGKKKMTIRSDALLVALGRVPNSDLLHAEKAGLRLNQAGYIMTNQFLETNVPGVYAAGDIAGKYFFKHSANLEAEYLVWNALHPDKKKAVDYAAMPHAIFTGPQIAGVGATEDQLEAAKEAYLVGRYQYKNTGMGTAIQEDGLVKILADPETRKILGCHIIGPEASTLIHEVVVAMRWNLTIDQLAETVHIHPALSEVVQRACLSVE